MRDTPSGMSRHNVELVRTAYDAWNRGDIDATLALCHPDFEWQTSGVFPGLDAIYRGHAGFRKYERDFRGTFESLSIVVEELRDRGDQVAMMGSFEGRGRDGVTVRRSVANVITLRDGLAVRIVSYGDWREALAAMGMRGSTPARQTRSLPVGPAPSTSRREQ